jgi:hypothetical protein
VSVVAAVAVPFSRANRLGVIVIALPVLSLHVDADVVIHCRVWKFGLVLGEERFEMDHNSGELHVDWYPSKREEDGV